MNVWEFGCSIQKRTVYRFICFFGRNPFATRSEDCCNHLEQALKKSLNIFFNFQMQLNEKYQDENILQHIMTGEELNNWKYAIYRTCIGFWSDDWILWGHRQHHSCKRVSVTTNVLFFFFTMAVDFKWNVLILFFIYLLANWDKKMVNWTMTISIFCICNYLLVCMIKFVVYSGILTCWTLRMCLDWWLARNVQRIWTCRWHTWHSNQLNKFWFMNKWKYIINGQFMLWIFF